LITGLIIQLPDTTEELIGLISGGINSNNFFLNFFIVNIWLALFNLIPAFPMDGGRVLRALLSLKLNRHLATKIAARIGQLIAIGFILLGFFSNPFLIVIGIFIIIGAQIEADFTESKYVLKGYKVRDVLMKQYPTIEAGEKIKKAVELILDSQFKNFLVTENEEPVGTLNRDQIIAALSKKGENAAIRTIMNKTLIFLHADALLETIFELVYENKSNLMLVTENDELIGTLDTENLLEFILIKEANSKSAHAKS